QEGFSRAAEALHISQPAVSKAVRELEHQLGLPLIERGGTAPRALRGVHLTEHGRALYEHARGIFALERTAIDDLRDRAGLMRGRLRIGASTTIAGYWLPPLIARFAAQAPGIELELLVGNTQAVTEATVDCRIELALVEGPVEDVRVRSQHWREEPLQIVAAGDSKLGARRRPDARALGALTWLMREAGSGTRAVTEGLLEQHGIAPRRTIEIGSNEAIARCVAEGAGVAMLPAAVVTELVAIGRLRAITPAGGAGFSRSLHWLELANRPRSPALQSFLDLLLGEAL
ncbi:MAG TPA: LysR substrate-binding domain-containing protein, partial [Rhodanobacteraceae bacterium]|nr:LysR substrate-binding domain-containing protein [Rhodanobacteraceae bacterium]